jgi:hypothetical protein
VSWARQLVSSAQDISDQVQLNLGKFFYVSIENGSQFCKDKSNFGFLTVSKSLIWKFSYEKEFFSIIYRSQRKIEKDKNMTFLAWSRMRFSKIYTLHRISENRKSVSTARESRVHFFHEPFFCEHEWDSQKNKIFVHLHKQSVKSKFACALFPHPWIERDRIRNHGGVFSKMSRFRF